MSTVAAYAFTMPIRGGDIAHCERSMTTITLSLTRSAGVEVAGCFINGHGWTLLMGRFLGVLLGGLSCLVVLHGWLLWLPATSW